MKKTLIATLTAAALAFSGLALAGCGESSNGGSGATGGANSGAKVITVAASPTPHADILKNAVAQVLEKEGYKLQVIEYNDYVQPNTVVEQAEVDANYFQHLPYLKSFNEENGTHLVEVVPVHYEPFGLYAGKSKSLDNIKDGAIIAVPNDTTNEARALLLLQQAGIITLKSDAGIKATPQDIVANPHNVVIKEVESATIPRIVDDVDYAAINANYAVGAGYSVYNDALVFEDPNGTAGQTYANYLVALDGNQNSAAIQALAKALNSDAVRDYIKATFADGSVQPLF